MREGKGGKKRKILKTLTLAKKTPPGPIPGARERDRNLGKKKQPGRHRTYRLTRGQGKAQWERTSISSIRSGGRDEGKN